MAAPTSSDISLRERIFLLVGASVWIGLTGVLDYASGVEIRIFPLYFLPICLVGWRLGYVLTLFTAWLSAAVWLVSNFEAGMQYSSLAVWVLNTTTQAVSFSVVGALTVFSRRAYWLAEARSRVDALTGLLNGAAFAEQTDRLAAFCLRHQRPLTITYIDIDNFKLVNDGFGHAEGDRVLAELGATMRETARETDLVARLGGDEFAIALAETDEAGAHIALTRLREALTRVFAGRPYSVTLSIGATVSTGTHAPTAQLLRRADALLYQAKAQGKDRFVIQAAES
jgi:diguanylate cyclase (GGDEF)-like protein